MKLENNFLTIDETDYDRINKELNIIGNERIHNLKKYGNTSIGPYKFDVIKRRLEELGVEDFYDEYSEVYSLDTNDKMIEELESIVSYVTGVDVKIFRAYYDSNIICPGDRFYTYLVWDKSRSEELRMALAQNELIKKNNRRRRLIKKTKNDITHPYKIIL